MIVANKKCLGLVLRDKTIVLIQPTISLRSPLMRSVTAFRRSLAGMAALTLLLFDHSARAQSGVCQSYEAAFNLEARLRDGLTLKQAKASIVDDGYSDGSSACFSAIKSEINQMPYAFPLVHQALFKRARR